MANVLGNYHDAWILTLAHEKGHILLNQICFQKGGNPEDTNNQLDAIGINLTEVQKKWIPDFHKESAIEAYCDATVLMHAEEYFPTQWNLIAQEMLKLREQASAQFKRSTLNQSYGDEYFCSVPIHNALQNGSSITPLQSAQIAFFSSLKNTPLHKDLSNAVQFSIAQLFERLKPSQPSIAEVVNTSVHASLGRLIAGIDNIKINKNALKNRSQVKNSYVPPSKPPKPKI